MTGRGRDDRGRFAESPEPELEITVRIVPVLPHRAGWDEESDDINQR